MVIALREFPVLAVKAVAAEIVDPRGATAVPAPVAHGAEYIVQDYILRVDRAALSHRHVVRRVKARSADVADGARELRDAVQGIAAAEGIAVVLDEPEPVGVAELLDCL